MKTNGKKRIYSRFPEADKRRGFFYGPVGAGRFGLLIAFIGIVSFLAALLWR